MYKINYYIENFVNKNYFYIIFLIFVFSILRCIYFGSMLFSGVDNLVVYDCFFFLFNLSKISEIANYMLGVVVLFLSFVILVVKQMCNQNIESDMSSTSFGLKFLIYIYFIYLILLHLIRTNNLYLILSIFIFSILLFCFYLRLPKLKKILDWAACVENNIKMGFINKIIPIFKKHIINFLLLIFSVIFILQIYPFVFKNIDVINEFSDIPSQTYLDQRGTYVDNQEFMKQNSFHDFVHKYRSSGQNVKKEMEEFIRYNHFQLHWQNLSRWVLFHHAHLLVPMNELELGREHSKIFAQYGIFNAYMLKTILKVTGGISYQNYFKIYYSFFYLYYALMLILIAHLTKNKKMTLIWLMSLVISLNVYTYEYVYLAPGCNPLRHFFDVPMFYILYKYFSENKSVYLIGAYLIAFMAILNNIQMGLFLYLAILPMLVLKFAIDKNKDNSLVKELLITVPTFGFVPLLVKYSNVGIDYTKDYFLSGLLGWHLHSSSLLMIFLAFMFAYIIMALFIKSSSKLKYILLFLVLYVQEILTYFVWGADAKHFMVILPVIAFTVIILLKFIQDNISNQKIINCVSIILILFGFIYGVIGSINYAKQYIYITNVFYKHKVYNWNLPKAKFQSNINPDYFTDSINMIKKYSKEKNIYMISKYDYFIPFLAEKYNDMPYLNIEWYVLSDKELQKSINYINNTKPKYLYVDKNIMFSENKLYTAYHPYTHAELLERQAHIDRIKNLEKLFDAVKDDYKPIESSYLLTVYRRKN